MARQGLAHRLDALAPAEIDIADDDGGPGFARRGFGTEDHGLAGPNQSEPAREIRMAVDTVGDQKHPETVPLRPIRFSQTRQA